MGNGTECMAVCHLAFQLEILYNSFIFSQRFLALVLVLELLLKEVLMWLEVLRC